MLVAERHQHRRCQRFRWSGNRSDEFASDTERQHHPDLTNVIKVRKGRETHAFRTDTLQDKKGILSLFRQLSEELAAKKRKEREGEHERRKSIWTGDVRVKFHTVR